MESDRQNIISNRINDSEHLFENDFRVKEFMEQKPGECVKNRLPLKIGESLYI